MKDSWYNTFLTKKRDSVINGQRAVPLGLATDRIDFKRIGLILDYYFNLAINSDTMALLNIPDDGATVMVCDERIIYKGSKEERSPTSMTFDFDPDKDTATNIKSKLLGIKGKKSKEFTMTWKQATELLKMLGDADETFFKTKKHANLFKVTGKKFDMDKDHPKTMKGYAQLDDKVQTWIETNLRPSFDEISSTSSIILRPDFLKTLNLHFDGMIPDKGPVLKIDDFIDDTIVFGGAICWAIPKKPRRCFEYAINMKAAQKPDINAAGLKALTTPTEITDVKFLYHYDRSLQPYYTGLTGGVKNVFCQNRPKNTYGEDDKELVEEKKSNIII